ncbi:MAG: PqqD family protein [Candidatus Omnitrophica bacterium]|nr:PqqD family protein [Candidatus Omnitrophota bacterium]
MNNGVYYGMNSTGARIWNLIQKPMRVKELLGTILREYDVETESCKGDLLLLLQKLAGEGLIDVEDAACA